MATVRITLPADLTAAQRRVALKYFEKVERLSPREWREVFKTFDTLANASLLSGKRRQETFRQFYERTIDRQYADEYLAGLLALDDLEAGGEALERETAAAILAMLEQEGLYHADTPDSEYLAAYCLYWWAAFCRGYRFELSIFRDLTASGIAFLAHDVTNPVERRSPSDLAVLGQVGDVKTTTYFLQEAHRVPLRSDFYITRLYLPRRRAYLRIVVLTETAWHALDGKVVKADLATAADILPRPLQIVFEGQSYFIVTYDEWKERVLRQQES